MMFGNMDPEETKRATVRCINECQHWKQYCLTSSSGDVYHPTAGCWLLDSSPDETSPVTLGTLLICLEALRTLAEVDNTLCFHLADIFREKFPSWVQTMVTATSYNFLSSSQNTPIG